jgi:CHASE2 domain-containing sensor protein/signal transduction histidine kinase
MTPPRVPSLRLQWWGITASLSVLVTAMTFDRTLLRLDNLIYDQLLRLNASAVDDRILLVAIDEDSLSQLGRWPWSRSTHAQIIDRLARAKARTIAYDVLFTEPSDATADAQLAESIARAGSLTLPVALVTPGRNGERFEAMPPIRQLREAASGIGYSNLEVDDGVVRAARPVLGQGTGWLHLMEVTRRKAEGLRYSDIGEALIPFAGRAGYWPTVPAAAVLTGQVPDEVLAGKLVLVGATAPGIAHQYPVPIGGVMSGLEIQANLLQGLLSNRMIRRAGLVETLLLGLLPLWAMMLLLGQVRRVPALAVFVLSVTGVMAATAAALAGLRVWLPPGAALAALAICYPLWGWRQLAVAQRFMEAQLAQFQQEAAIGTVAQRAGGTGGSVSSVINLLRSAIANYREMRDYIVDRLEQLPDPTLITSPDGEVALANTAARHVFPDADLRTGANVIPLLLQFRRGQNEPISFPPTVGEPDDVEASVPDGRYFSVRIAEQTSPAGERIGWVIRLMDVSEAKAAQRQRDDIMHLLTHDMRSPQASILAVLETTAPEDISPETSARIRQYAERTLRLADGFVQLARAENLDYILEEVDLGDMLLDAVDDLWPQSQAKSINIVTLGTDERLPMMAERSLVTRAIINVIGNAIKYSPEHTTISCRVSRTLLEDGCSRGLCTISDEGRGFAPEQRQTMFERFQRGPTRLDSNVEGVGLGLSFVHTVVLRHGGEIHCESEPGHGSSFTLVLPLAPGV